MRIIGSFFLMAALSFSVMASAPKIAMIGYGDKESQIVEIAMAELSGQYDFVERQAINAIQKEQRLNRVFAAEDLAIRLGLAGADIFAVVQSNKQGLWLTVFESGCGLRLKQMLLPDEAVTAAAGVKTAVADAVARNDRPDLVRFISFAGIRNNLQRRGLNDLASDILQRFAALDVALLEREYLIELLRERRLSSKWEHALTASEIVHFELNHGRNAGDVVVIVHCSDPAGALTFSYEIEEAGTEKLNQLFVALDRYLRQPQNFERGRFNRKTEAARFAREAQIFKQNNDIVGELKHRFAAFALCPDEAEMCVKVITGWGAEKDTPHLYPYYKFMLEHLLTQPDIIGTYPYEDYHKMILKRVFDNRLALTEEQKNDFRDFLALYRETFLSMPAYMKETIQYEPEKAVNRFYKQERALYFYQKEYFQALLADWERVLLALEAGRPNDMPEREWNYFLTNYLRRVNGNLLSILYEYPQKRRMFSWVEEQCRRLEAIDTAHLKPMIPLLRANLMLFSKDYTEEKALAAFEEYFKCFIENNTSHAIFPTYYLLWQVNRYPGLPKKLSELERKYRRK